MIKSRLEKLRDLMKNRGIDIYIIPTDDYHMSEYVGDFFKCRSWISGFTGSAGTVVVGINEAGLWADGRYFIQAEQQLEGSGIKLFKMGEENVPTVKEYIEKNLKKGMTLGFDARVINAYDGQEYAALAEKKEASIICELDLVGDIWTDRAEISTEPAYLLEDKYVGKTVSEKLAMIREKMKENDADSHIVATLDDIAWIYNIRGNDIAYNPVVLAFSVITMEKAYIFASEKAIGKDITEILKKDNIDVLPYDQIYDFVANMGSDGKVLVDTGCINYRIFSSIKMEIVDKNAPSTEFKAIKNEVELENTKKAHIKDGVAVTKFMYWLKENIGKIPMTEISASDYLEELRKEQEGFIELSFDTISAYKANAAMMHYSADENSNAVLEPKGMLLVDSGGQYYEGTTDITRTFALGELTEEEKTHYTAVTRGMLNLLNAKFLYGCRGVNVDILARQPIWDLDIDYKCGTGHGVGHILNVHEGPNGIRWKLLKDNAMNAVLEEGMITTDEPGVYIEGSHGIRIENEMICRKGTKNEHGQFMYFENITFAPIDLDAINPELMSVKERELLNAYHKEVYEVISPYLNDEEKAWLKKYTRNI